MRHSDHPATMEYEERLRSQALSDSDGDDAQTLESSWGQTWERIKFDLVLYLGEFGLDVSSDERVTQRELQFCDAANMNDVFIVVKEGCGFCERAKKTISDYQRLQQVSVKFLVGTDVVSRRAIHRCFRRPDITFPLVVVQGLYIGGADDLQSLVSHDKLRLLLNAERVTSHIGHPIEWYPPLVSREKTVDLLSPPGGGPKVYWYFFQLNIYSNLIRYVSCIHLLLLGVAMALFQNANVASPAFIIGNMIILLLVADLAAIVLHGLSPFSISGTICTYLFWNYRGNISSSLPYKFVFAIYIAVLIPLIGSSSSTKAAGIATLTSLLVNSSLLAVLRF
jgi:glutaredoxin-related protein